MNGRQRNVTNAEKWGKFNDSNYDGNCTSRDFQFGTEEISGSLIFVEHRVQFSTLIFLNISVTCSIIRRYSSYILKGFIFLICPVAQLIGALRYRSEGCRFDSQWCH